MQRRRSMFVFIEKLAKRSRITISVVSPHSSRGALLGPQPNAIDFSSSYVTSIRFHVHNQNWSLIIQYKCVFSSLLLYRVLRSYTHTALNVHMIRPQNSVLCCDKKKKNANEIPSLCPPKNGILPFLCATQTVAVYASVAGALLLPLVNQM